MRCDRTVGAGRARLRAPRQGDPSRGDRGYSQARRPAFEHDESCARRSAEALAGLAPQPGTTQMTAGNSSPLNDGAARSCSRAAGAEGTRLQAARARRGVGHPCARSTLHGDRAGVGDPEGALASRAGPAQIDIWEIHEAYAVVALGSCRSYRTSSTASRFPTRRLNPNGGAVAIGHPFGSSGTRYVLTLATELRRRGPVRRPRRLRRVGSGGRAGARERRAAQMSVVADQVKPSAERGPRSA